MNDRDAVLAALHAQLPVIWRLLPEGLTLTPTDDSVTLRGNDSGLLVQKTIVTGLGPRHFLTSLLDEIQVVAADLLSEYWPRIGTCHLDYDVQEVDGQFTLVFWPASLEAQEGLWRRVPTAGQ
ncbi:hypothetical protein [Deinococcus ficus]|uniref:Uncharacterized protein n=1 Tax=Deinococcus ficus TaxID=317577 RepID=A0A221T0N4_9DEIO|nr:hypothetical protein [Deinococcus ficus]ASN82455.1 hypothetical protein DFI_14825 [Deinococcus ficus]